MWIGGPAHVRRRHRPSIRAAHFAVLPSVLFRMFETFSYLPPLSDREISKQVDYIVNNGWSECLAACGWRACAP